MVSTSTHSGPQIPEPKNKPRDRTHWLYIAVIIAVVGGIQIILAVLQAAGVSIGVHVGHSMGGHVVNESTAWSVALGVAMLVAAARPAAAMGLAIVGGVFTLVLTGYVVVLKIRLHFIQSASWRLGLKSDSFNGKRQ